MLENLPSSGAVASLARGRGEPVACTVLTLCLLICFSTMWSLLFKTCFSLRRLGLGKNWGREREYAAAGKEPVPTTPPFLPGTQVCLGSTPSP